MTITADDKFAIQELFARCAYAYDERKERLLADCFTTDAVFTLRIAGGDLVGPFEGRESIMGLMTGSMAEQTDVRRHVVSNLFFEEEGAEPVAISGLTLIATENEDIQLLSAGIYRDVVTKQEGIWRICKRHLDLDKAY